MEPLFSLHLVRSAPSLDIEVDSPVVVKAVSKVFKDYKKVVQRIGEAKNPGPGPESFRGDLARVHHCGQQLLFLQGRVPKSSVTRVASKLARMEKKKSVVASPRKKQSTLPDVRKVRNVPVHNDNSKSVSKPRKRDQTARLEKMVHRATLLHNQLRAKPKAGKKK